MSPARDGILPVGRAPLRASEEWSWHPGRVPDVAQRDDWTDLAPIPTRAVAATADADRHASDALGIFLRPSRTPGRRAEIDRFPRSALNRAAVVEVTGRYLNPSDQGERLHDLLQIVPSRLNGQYSNQEGRPSTAETGAGRGVGHRLQTGSTVYQLAEQFRINRQTVSRLLEREGVPRRGRPLSPAQIEQATRLYATGLSLVSVGKQLGCDGSTVHLALRKAAVRMRDIHGRGGYTAPFGAQSTVAKVVIMRRFSACSPCCQVRLEAFTAWSCENRRSALVAT